MGHVLLFDFTPKLTIEKEKLPMTAPITRIGMGSRYSEASIFNGIIYLAGMVPECAENDIVSQTRDVLTQIDHHLKTCGSDKTQLLRVQIYLADIADIAAMNTVWDAWVAPGHAPPRATVQAALADPHWRIEIVATAAVATKPQL